MNEDNFSDLKELLSAHGYLHHCVGGENDQDKSRSCASRFAEMVGGQLADCDPVQESYGWNWKIVPLSE